MQKLTGREKDLHSHTLASALETVTDEPCCSKNDQHSLPSPVFEAERHDDDSCDDMDDIEKITDVMDEGCEIVSVDDKDVNISQPQTSNQTTVTEVRHSSAQIDSLINQSTSPLFDVEVKKEEVEKELKDGLRLKRFTCDEAAALKEGVTKYGYGMWRQILKDDTLNFHPLRTRDSLRMRAKTLKLNNRPSKKGKR